MMNGDNGRVELFCAEQTREAGEPIFGTATEVQTWLLLEYRQPWREKATTDNELPADVQLFLDKQLATIPGSRLLFIKQEKPNSDMLRLFIVRSHERSPQTFELQIRSYEELLKLDIAGLSQGQNQFNRYMRGRPLILVCTNGNRDKCCAKYGLPMVKALQSIAGDDVWQASHMGGHRYAPNIILFPYCVNYGLMEADQGRSMIEAAGDGMIFDLDHFRGRNYYQPAVQAADYFLRRELDIHGFSDVLLLGAEIMDAQNTLVTFLTTDGKRHRLGIKQEKMEASMLVSCSTPKTKSGVRFHLTGYWEEGKKLK